MKKLSEKGKWSRINDYYLAAINLRNRLPKDRSLFRHLMIQELASTFEAEAELLLKENDDE